MVTPPGSAMLRSLTVWVVASRVRSGVVEPGWFPHTVPGPNGPTAAYIPTPYGLHDQE